MFKLALTMMIFSSFFSCLEYSKELKSESASNLPEQSEVEFIEVEDSLCDTDSDCVKKFGCVGVYSSDTSSKVDYACSDWEGEK